MIEYIPKTIMKPAHLIEVPSAWKGLESILFDIIKEFKLDRKTAVEFGVEYGYSTAALANYFERVIGVDTFTGDVHSGKRSSFYEQTQDNLKEFKNIFLIKKDYKEFIESEDNKNAKIDLSHIDIVHNYAETYECGLWAAKHSKVAIFHDTMTFSEVRRAVEDIAKEVGKTFYNYPNYCGLGIIK